MPVRKSASLIPRARARLSPPALRRHAPARDDRHRARLPAELLIADEPTTALDVTIQAQILDLLLRLKRENGMALVLITHDLGVVAETADRVIVQYAGEQVEANATEELFDDPTIPIPPPCWPRPERRQNVAARDTRRRAGAFDRPQGCLFAPRCAFAFDACHRVAPRRAGRRRRRAMPHAAEIGRASSSALAGGAPMTATLEARSLAAITWSRAALSAAGDGEGSGGRLVLARSRPDAGGRRRSGSGKSTLARLLTLIEAPTDGALIIDGEDVADASAATRRRLGARSRWCSRTPMGR